MKLLISTSSKLEGNSSKVNAVLKAAVNNLASFKGSSISVMKADTANVFKVKLSSSINGTDLQKLMADLSFIADRKDWLEIQRGSLLIVRVDK